MLGRPASCAPGLKERDRRIVVDRLRVHRPHDAEIVDDPRRVRQQLAQPDAGLSVPGKLETGRGDREARLRGRHSGEPLAHPDRIRQLGAAEALERRLVIEQVHLRRSARLEDVTSTPACRFRHSIHAPHEPFSQQINVPECNPAN
jgi:hypothetical protein